MLLGQLKESKAVKLSVNQKITKNLSKIYILSNFLNWKVNILQMTKKRPTTNRGIIEMFLELLIVSIQMLIVMTIFLPTDIMIRKV
jgi:hypothetical protein